ncbi:transposable element Tcb2 transposase [Trichonephila clavipes]|nr:transposable element Tcb2 transposase [Trichonephila clavipes]
MVWAGIMINGRTRLHVVANGTMTGQRYIDEVLLPHVRLFRGAVGDKLVFMDDNATCHRTLAVQDCLDSEGIQLLVWPARSPDLNPIENVWNALGRHVAGRNYPPTNKNTLIRALTEEWDKLPQQLLDNVVQNCDCGRGFNCTFSLFNSRRRRVNCICTEGYYNSGGFCHAICNSTHPCQNGGTCQDGRCKCMDRTWGDFCEDIEGCGECTPRQVVDCVYDQKTKEHACLCKSRSLEYDYIEKVCKPCPCGEGICKYTRPFVKLELHCDCNEGYKEFRARCKKCDCGPNSSCEIDQKTGERICKCEDGFVAREGRCIACNCGMDKIKCELINNTKHCNCPIGYEELHGTCEGTAIRGFSSGRPRGTTPADDRYIVLQARRNRRQTAGEIARYTTQATGRPISRFTVARRLHGGGLFARRPVRCVPLTPAHRRRHESRFSLSSDSYRILIWRERGSRNHPSNIIERDRYGGHGVLVWGGIMLGSRADLHIFDAGSVNGTRYCNEILLPYVRLFRGAMGLQFLFMDDNAPCHRTVAAEQLLESEDIERMEWPARSPDLNPIEHVWDFLGRRLAASTLPPVTIREFRLALQDEWAAMPPQLIDTLILSMGRRCETCLAVRGDHIPY